jgi:primosomal protein N'
MSQQRPGYKCPNCDHRLEETQDPQTYRCSSCNRDIRESVCERMESFKRVAESDGPAAEIAQAALQGVRDE